jgi:hypothetical protein
MKVRPTGVIPPMTTPFARDGEEAQQPAIRTALEGLGALGGRRVEAAE